MSFVSTPVTQGQITVTINGVTITSQVSVRQHLADFLREAQGLTGTHLGCEHGVCGACTVLVDDVPVRSCLMLAVQVDGKAVRTIEGFDDDSAMQRLQEAFARRNAAQCGFCTPGMLITARELVRSGVQPSRDEVRMHLSGNLCRCTGYQAIVDAVVDVCNTASMATSIESGGDT